MVEVGVGCEKHPASVKFIIHNLFIHAHHCVVNNTLQFCPWTELTGKTTSCERHQQAHTKTVEKFGKDSPTVFIYRFSGIPASSYPRWSIKRSSENVSRSIECPNARSMDTRQSLKAFYASIQYGVPVVHSSLQHLSFMFLFN